MIDVAHDGHDRRAVRQAGVGRGGFRARCGPLGYRYGRRRRGAFPLGLGRLGGALRLVLGTARGGLALLLGDQAFDGLDDVFFERAADTLVLHAQIVEHGQHSVVVHVEIFGKGINSDF